MERPLLGLYEKSMPGDLGLAAKLREARAAGYDYMELSIDESDEKLARLTWDSREIASLRAAFDEGVSIKSICLSGHRRFPLGHPDPATRERSLEIMRGAIGLASALGVRIIQIAGYDVYYERSTEASCLRFAEGLAQSVEMAAREGVMLAFETMETEFLDTVEKAMRWVNEIDSPYLQIYPDIGNITNAAKKYGGDALRDLEKGRGRLAAMHLKETKPGVYRELPYGQGHVDFSAAIATALRLGVRLFVGEFWYHPGSDWRATLRGNNDFLRAAIEAGMAKEKTP
jgi:Putative L-xylulose-5-phosphate 3-epimerase